MSTHVPSPLRGLWRREAITTPSGSSDTTTRVMWLQARSWYADIRVPADRPSPPAAPGFSAFTDAELLQLADQQGFAGELAVSDEVCLWRRDLDYQPPGPAEDEAFYRIEGPVMVEDGVHAAYREIWRRAPEGEGPSAAFRLETPRGGLLVVAGDCFMEIEARAEPLPPGESLADIVRAELAAGRRAAAEAHLSLRICYGRIQGGRRPWEIVLSTLPWLEGRALLGPETRYDAAAGRLEDCDQAWTLLDASVDPSLLATAMRLPSATAA